jgi:mRNA-degrading endonuclease RelE of RelBE toxin-antitoxin system
MSVYKPVYSIGFEDDISDFELNKNIAVSLGKAIVVILEQPYFKAAKVEGENGLMRKHVCANKFRIFYFVDEVKKEVVFAHFRPKDKNTYKNL